MRHGTPEKTTFISRTGSCFEKTLQSAMFVVAVTLCRKLGRNLYELDKKRCLDKEVSHGLGY